MTDSISNNSVKLFLASSSPRRRELLSILTTDFLIRSSDIDETPQLNEASLIYVRRMAREKAEVCGEKLVSSSDLQESQTLILGSDTSGILDEEILTKPRDFSHFRDMMMRMSNRAHTIASAVSLISVTGDKVQHLETIVVQTEVRFKDLTEKEVVSYWDTGEPCDKAGGYGIQGLGSIFVEGIDGSYSNVVGLPLKETAELLQRHGFDIWEGHTSS